MPLWKCEAQVIVSAYTLIEAETAEEARAIAKHRSPHLCPLGPEQHGVNPGESFVIENADGDVGGTWIVDLAEAEDIEGPEKRQMLQQCLKAAEMMRMILNRFQDVSEYRTRPYLPDVKILDIGLDSIYGTPWISDNEKRHKPGPAKK